MSPQFTQIQINGNNIVVQTENYFKQKLKMKVTTKSSPNFYFLPIDIIVCGFEKIINSRNYELKVSETYDRYTSVESVPKYVAKKYVADVVNALQSTEPRCPIKSIELRDL